MPGQPLTPELALEHLRELSSEIRAAVLLDGAGSLVACTDPQMGTMAGGERARRYAELARELFERVDASVPEPPEQVQTQLPEGAVYAVRGPRWMLAVVSDRGALASLMFYDLRSVLSRLRHGSGQTERASA